VVQLWAEFVVGMSVMLPTMLNGCGASKEGTLDRGFQQPAIARLDTHQWTWLSLMLSSAFALGSEAFQRKVFQKDMEQHRLAKQALDATTTW
jgi:hypothetical protein